MTTDIKERLRTLSFAMGKIGADSSSRLYEEAAAHIEKLEASQLSAQTAEPVAWRKFNGAYNAYQDNKPGIQFETNGWTPLYTHPPVIQTEQPSLSDERIWDIYVKAQESIPFERSSSREFAIALTNAILAQRQDSDKDAERYRWLRDHHPQSDVCGTDDREEFDAEVDRAIANGAPK